VSDDDLTFASAGVACVHYARCWPCMLDGPCPGGWHTWADEEDVRHALNTGQPDPSDKICGCPCAVGPVLDPEPDEPDWESLEREPCLICGEPGACGYDAEGRPMVHAIGYDDEPEGDG